MSDIKPILDKASQNYVDTVKQYQWNLLPDSQLQAAGIQLSRSPYIMKVATENPESVFNALYQAAVLGLDLTEGKRQAWLIPRKIDKGKTGIVLQPGYKGVEAIHQRMGVIKRCEIALKYENDTFVWTGKANDIPELQGDWFNSASRGELEGAYIVTHYPDGTHQTIVESLTKIKEKHRDRSESYKVYIAKKNKGEWAHEPPWISDEEEMVKKTMVFIASKQWPSYDQNQETNSKILETLNSIEVSDYSPNYTPEQKAIFYELLDARDGLGLELFRQHVGAETDIHLWLGVRSSIPRGEKDKTMGQIQDECGDGGQLFDDIRQALAEEDIGLLYESLEGSTSRTKEHLYRRLSAAEQLTYTKMTTSLEEAKNG